MDSQQKNVDTLVISKFLQTVVDNSGPETKSYEGDRPLPLQITNEKKKEEMRDTEEVLYSLWELMCHLNLCSNIL